jgi:hypothetical protein
MNNDKSDENTQEPPSRSPVSRTLDNDGHAGHARSSWTTPSCSRNQGATVWPAPR